MERNALYRRGFRAALRPTARACAVATPAVAALGLAALGLAVIVALAWPAAAAGVDAASGASTTDTESDSHAPAVRCQGASETPCRWLEVGGRARSFRLHVPPRPADRPALLVVLHGGGGNGAIAEKTNGARFNALADRDGVLVAYPDGYDRQWNDGRGDLPARTVREGIDDVAFLKALVAELVATHGVDPARVYVTGMSNGAMMRLRLACEADDAFRGFFAVAGNLGVELASRCRPAHVARLAIAFGTDDPLVPWAGGEVRVLGRARGAVVSTERTFATFLEAARCRGARAGAPSDREPDDATTLVVHRAYGCRDDVDLRLYEIRGGGHVWPGGARRERAWLLGRATRELDATPEVWEFFGLGRAAR